MSIQESYQNLLKFDEILLNLGKPISDDRLEKFEQKIGHDLTAEFKYIMKKHNGLSVSGCDIYGIGEEFKNGSLDKMYDLISKYYQDFIPKSFIPFSPDGAGNYYCLDLSRSSGDICPIVFYQSNYEYADLTDVETCNNSLEDWINEVMIEWNS